MSSRTKSMHLLQITVVFAMTLMLAIMIWTLWSIHNIDDNRRQVEVAACERANTVRYKQNLVIQTLESHFHFTIAPPTPIVDCEVVIP